MRIHALLAAARDHFVCAACDFQGSLREAIVHAVRNQFTAH